LFPLGILDRTPNSSEIIVRTVLGVDEETQSLSFAGDIPEDSTVQLMRCNIDRLIENTAGVAGELSKEVKGPALTIAVSCVGRRMVMRDRTEETLEAVLDTLPEGTLLVGLFAYGELSPISSGPCQLQNQAMSLTLIQED
jgi:hypothetical protein